MPPGNAVDLSEFTAVADADEAEAMPTSPPRRPSRETKPARKRAAKKADADDAPADAEAADAEEPKKPARKRATKKADAE